MANTYLTSGNLSSAGNQKKWTFSAWLKKATIGVDNAFFGFYQDSNNYTIGQWRSDDLLRFGNVGGGSWTVELAPNAVYRDLNAWYHVVFQYDSGQATSSNRASLWVNGVKQSSFATAVYPSQDANTRIPNNGYPITIGRGTKGSNTYYMNGCMSHVHFCDGYAYQASDFGSTDTTTGEWKINTSPSVSYGTHGFFLLKNDNAVTDRSGQGNNFTLGGGTLTKTEDCPSNVFATLNPLSGSTDATFIAGNTTAYFGTASSRSILTSTLGASSGKYYWECKIGGNVSPNNAILGVGLSNYYSADSNPVGYKSDSWGYGGYNGQVINNSSSVGGTWSTFGDGDIIGVAVNLDNEQGGLNKLYFSKNGVWQNGADPSNHSSTTGVVGITKPENGATGFLFAQFGDAGSSATPRHEVNFGNGYFQETAISSAGTNASGNGIFEYDVPTNFTALSTKGLNL